MKNSVNNLPQKKTQTLYHFVKAGSSKLLFETTTSVASQGDPTNTCTTILTSTHIF